jgi:hypothetical protein
MYTPRSYRFFYDKPSAGVIREGGVISDAETTDSVGLDMARSDQIPLMSCLMSPPAWSASGSRERITGLFATRHTRSSHVALNHSMKQRNWR